MGLVYHVLVYMGEIFLLLEFCCGTPPSCSDATLIHFPGTVHLFTLLVEEIFFHQLFPKLPGVLHQVMIRIFNPHEGLVTRHLQH